MEATRARAGAPTRRATASSTARARARDARRRRRARGTTAAFASDANVERAMPTPTERAGAMERDARETRGRPRAETLVDAFESLPREERVRLVERYVLGDADDVEAPAVVIDGAAAIGGAIARDVEREDEDAARGMTEEELADLRDFGPSERARGDALGEDALVDKWREIFGEDPPENNGGGVDDILGADDGAFGGGVLEEARNAATRRAYAAERGWKKLVNKFGRQGAIVASGFASVSVVAVLSALFATSNADAKSKVKDEAGGVAPALESEDDPVAGDVKAFVEPTRREAPAPAPGGVLWERKVIVDDDDASPSSSSSSASNGVLWTRRSDEERRKPSARDRMGVPTATFDDRNRDRRGSEPPPQVIWTRKNDPEIDELDEDPQERSPPRRASEALDDNLEDLRAFRRPDRESPR